MTFLANPLGLTPEEFKAYAEKLNWTHWRPSFVVLHNTAEPNVAQWTHFGLGKTAGARRVQNLNHYYQSDEGWHSGPHIFVAPDLIWIACDLAADGVHASCYNSLSIGVEMVGDYSIESFNEGEGAQVRDNAVACLAALHKALKIDPETLHFHKECLRDHHECPGKNVDKADMIARVKAWSGVSASVSEPVPTTPALAQYVESVAAAATIVSAILQIGGLLPADWQIIKTEHGPTKPIFGEDSLAYDHAPFI